MRKLYAPNMIADIISKNGSCSKIDAIGIILHVKNIRMVGWKEEEILSLSDGFNTMLEISYWKNQEFPRGLNSNCVRDIKGRIIIVKNVTILSDIDKTEETITVFGRLQMGQHEHRHILVLENDIKSLNNFKVLNEAIKINKKLSVIPQPIAGTKAADVYPILTNEIMAMKIFVPLAIRYIIGLNRPWELKCEDYFEKAIVRYSEFLNSGVNEISGLMQDLNL